MAVLVEGISVLVSIDAIHARYAGGWERFVQLAPNHSLCNDDEIVRVGFITTGSALEFVEHLESFGLTFLSHGQAVDIVVCDQHNGPVAQCDWLQFTRMPFESGQIGMAWRRPLPAAGNPAPSADLRLVAPAGWAFAGSLSEKFS